jgi:hypothetical protein
LLKSAGTLASSVAFDSVIKHLTTLVGELPAAEVQASRAVKTRHGGDSAQTFNEIGVWGRPSLRQLSEKPIFEVELAWAVNNPWSQEILKKFVPPKSKLQIELDQLKALMPQARALNKVEFEKAWTAVSNLTGYKGPIPEKMEDEVANLFDELLTIRRKISDAADAEAESTIAHTGPAIGSQPVNFPTLAITAEPVPLAADKFAAAPEETRVAMSKYIYWLAKAQGRDRAALTKAREAYREAMASCPPAKKPDDLRIFLAASHREMGRLMDMFDAAEKTKKEQEDKAKQAAVNAVDGDPVRAGPSVMLQTSDVDTHRIVSTICCRIYGERNAPC